MARMLHEIIAVEGDKISVAGHIVQEAHTTFTKRTEHFAGHVRRTEMFDADRQGENTSEVKEIVETVPRKLQHVWSALTAALDITATKEVSNCSEGARADVMIDGLVVLESVPATVLLGLEKRLRQIRELYSHIPTLDPTYTWIKDASLATDMYRTQNPTEQLKTEKTLEHKIVYEATKEHPAQIEKWTKDKPVGKITLERTSGMVSVEDKARWIKRITELETAVKEARQRANKADATELKVAEILREYIHRT